MRVYSPASPQRSKRHKSWQSVVLPYFLIGSLLAFTGAIFGSLVTRLGDLEISHADTFYCLPNGKIYLPQHITLRQHQYYSTWDASQFLSITLGFGAFSFSAAKAIDISWDLVVGRGGQAVLIWICYPLFRRALARVMETKSITLPTYAAMAFGKVSLGTTYMLCSPASILPPEGSSGRRDWRFVLMGLASAYLLAFPTFLSSVTGYQARMIPYVKDPDGGDLVPMTNWTQPDFIVKDGGRVGLSDDYALVMPGFNMPVSSMVQEMYNALDCCKPTTHPRRRVALAVAN